MKKGFTLIELISVIVIIGVIALITTPIVSGIINKSKQNAYEQTVTTIENAAYNYSIYNNLGYNKLYKTLYLSQIQEKGYLQSEDIIDPRNDKEMTGCVLYRWSTDENQYEFTYDDDCNTEGLNPEIAINVINDNNKTWLNENLKFEIVGTYDTNRYCVGSNDCTPNINYTGTTTIAETGTDIYVCVTGYMGEEKGSSSCTKAYNIDPIKPELTINSIATTSSKIIIDAECSDSISGVQSIQYSINNGEYQNINVFSNLTSGTYVVKTKCTDNALNETINEQTKVIGIPNPTIAQLSQTPINSTYATERVIRITYYNENVDSPRYYYSLDGEKWTEVTTTTYDVIFTANGYLYAKTEDAAGNVANAATYTVTNIDPSKPNTSIAVGTMYTDRTTVTATCTDTESGITKYEFSSDGGSTYEKTYTTTGTSQSHTFTGLIQDKEYTFAVRCTNGSGLTNTASNTGNTEIITNPTIAYVNTPTTAVNGYLTSQTIKVTYNSSNIAAPQYFVKTDRAGVSSLSVTQSCGTGTEPTTCKTITSTTSLSANTWYKVSGNVNVTYSDYATSEGTLYVLTYDGKNYSGSVTATISKITKEVTYIVNHYQMNTDMTNYTLYETETLTGTANYTATPSVKTYTGFTSPSTQTVTVSADGSTVVEYKYTRKQVVVAFYRNTSTSDTTKASQTFTYGVSGQAFTNKGWTRSGYTIGGWRSTNSGPRGYAITNGVGDAWINNLSPATNLYAIWYKNPTFTQTSATIASGYTWATQRVIQITYDGTNITSPTYYLKSDVSATVASGVVTAVCGNGTNPGTCTTSSVTTLAAGYWYKTTSTTPSVTYTSNGNLYAATYDGISVYATSTYNIAQTSSGTPSAPTIAGGSTSWVSTPVTINISTTSTETSGISHYQYYLSKSSASLVAGSWTDVTSGVTSFTITPASNVTSPEYIFVRAVGNNGVVGTTSNYQQAFFDTAPPTVTVSVSGLIATITMSDGIAVYGYGVNQSTSTEPSYTVVNSGSKTITHTTTAAGNYVVWVKDIAGNVTKTSFTTTATYLCKRATVLHSEGCDSSLCTGAGYSLGDAVVYGNKTVTAGKLTLGDAFDCDVNGDGTYDSKTERFYYLADVDSTYAALIYYGNTYSNGVSLKGLNAYNSSGTTAVEPSTAITYIPTTTAWSNVSLTNTSRQVYNELGGTTAGLTGGSTVYTYDLGIADYSGRAGRLPTYTEIINACGSTTLTTKCEFLLENSNYSNSKVGFWVETYKSVNTSSILAPYYVYGTTMTAGAPPSTTGPAGTRPVIEVNKSLIDTSSATTTYNTTFVAVSCADYYTSFSYQGRHIRYYCSSATDTGYVTQDTATCLTQAKAAYDAANSEYTTCVSNCKTKCYSYCDTNAKNAQNSCLTSCTNAGGTNCSASCSSVYNSAYPPCANDCETNYANLVDCTCTSTSTANMQAFLDTYDTCCADKNCTE